MTVSYKASSPFTLAHLEWEPLVRGLFLIQTSLQPGERPEEADIKRTGLSFHKKGTVHAAASGNPKNRNVPTVLLWSKTKPKPLILQRGGTHPWTPAWLPGRAQGPPVIFPGPSSLLGKSPTSPLVAEHSPPATWEPTGPATGSPRNQAGRLPPTLPRMSPRISAPQRGRPDPDSLHSTHSPAHPALRHLN